MTKSSLTKRIFLAVGLMSGTSMDGIDAALIKTDGDYLIENIANYSLSYDAEFKLLLKAAEYNVRACCGNLSKAADDFLLHLTLYLQKTLNVAYERIPQTIHDLANYVARFQQQLSLAAITRLSTLFHQHATERLLAQQHLSASDIDFIGYHGQTVYHAPHLKITVQLGEPDYLAKACNIAVVAHFRENDIQHGGQGAPLAPIYHQALAIRDHRMPLAVVNCGGIANISLIDGDNITDVIGFDTGPGNTLIDRMVKQRTHGQEHMDTDGKYGLKGHILDEVQNLLWQKACLTDDQQNYLERPAPKSLDVNNCHLIPELDELSLPDACANLAAFTAYTIVDSGRIAHVSLPTDWVLVGGGWYNPLIKKELEKMLHKFIGANVHIQTADQVGWQNNFIEAQLFAYLAVRSYQQKPLSFPKTTGVEKAVTGGQLYDR